MSKHIHEIRDPIHVFVRLDSGERAVLDSRPFQRLRHIHQLALTYMLYPAATHRGSSIRSGSWSSRGGYSTW
jgi:HD superfamily phosphohydrolase